MNADPCRKSGKKDHPTDRCHSKITCKKCKGKDHATRFCTVATTTAGYNCTFSRKGKYLIENCRAKRRAKRRAQMRATNLVTTSNTSNVSQASIGQPTAPLEPSPQAVQVPQIPVTLPNMSISPSYRSEATTNGQWCWCKQCVNHATWVTTITGATHMYSPTDHGWKQSLLNGRINCIPAHTGFQ